MNILQKYNGSFSTKGNTKGNFRKKNTNGDLPRGIQRKISQRKHKGYFLQREIQTIF